MTVDSNPSLVPAGSGSGRRRRWLAGAPLLATGLLAGAIAAAVGQRMAHSAFLDLGPTDARFVEGFREIERDGPIYFRWTSGSGSRLTLPVRFCGPGSVRMRVRRHFVDPAVLSVSLNGALIGQRSVQARSDHPYEILEFPVSKVICTSDVSILLESSSGNGRELGVALDWVEVRSDGGGFRPRLASLTRGALIVALATGACLLVGASTAVTVTSGVAVAFLVGGLMVSSPVAAEQVMRGGVVAGFATLVLGVVLARLVGVSALPLNLRVAIALLSGLTLLSRLAFLHPQAFYPDYRVHALVQQTLDSLGLSGFLDQLFEIQYARSLGLQQVGSNWYPFPYPPGAYLITSAIGSFFGLQALEGSVVTAVIAGSLIPILTVGIGLSLGFSPAGCVGGAFFVALQPLLVRRIALGYFPGVIGQFLDALAVLLLVALAKDADRRAWRPLAFGAALVVAFLVYTQSIANFGLLAAALLGLELIRTRRLSSGSLKIAGAAALALLASFAAFYWRYVPVMDNVANHRVQPESVVLDRLEHLRRNALLVNESSEGEDVNDPYAGATLNPARGLARLVARVWRFYGVFALALLPGLWLVWAGTLPKLRNAVAAWASVALSISLLAAGLPSPNGFQHLKDLEFVTPLLSLGLGLVLVRLHERGKGLAIAFSGLWVIFAIYQWTIEFSDRFQRSLGL